MLDEDDGAGGKVEHCVYEIYRGFKKMLVL